MQMRMQLLCWDRDVVVLVCVGETVSVESGGCGSRTGRVFEKDRAGV